MAEHAVAPMSHIPNAPEFHPILMSLSLAKMQRGSVSSRCDRKTPLAYHSAMLTDLRRRPNTHEAIFRPPRRRLFKLENVKFAIT